MSCHAQMGDGGPTERWVANERLRSSAKTVYEITGWQNAQGDWSTRPFQPKRKRVDPIGQDEPNTYENQLDRVCRTMSGSIRSIAGKELNVTKRSTIQC